MDEDQRSDGTLWDRRFAQSVYAYGKEPNAWLKACISRLSPAVSYTHLTLPTTNSV